MRRTASELNEKRKEILTLERMGILRETDFPRMFEFANSLWSGSACLAVQMQCNLWSQPCIIATNDLYKVRKSIEKKGYSPWYL